MRDRHDKRLCVFVVLVRLFFTIFAVVLTFPPFSIKMAVFGISEKYSFDNRNFEKLNFVEYFYHPSQHFFVVKAFNRFLVFRRKVALCQSGRMAHKSHQLITFPLKEQKFHLPILFTNKTKEISKSIVT